MRFATVDCRNYLSGGFLRRCDPKQALAFSHCVSTNPGGGNRLAAIAFSAPNEPGSEIRLLIEGDGTGMTGPISSGVPEPGSGLIWAVILAVAGVWRFKKNGCRSKFKQLD